MLTSLAHSMNESNFSALLDNAFTSMALLSRPPALSTNQVSTLAAVGFHIQDLSPIPHSDPVLQLTTKDNNLLPPLSDSHHNNSNSKTHDSGSSFMTAAAALSSGACPPCTLGENGTVSAVTALGTAAAAKQSSDQDLRARGVQASHTQTELPSDQSVQQTPQPQQQEEGELQWVLPGPCAQLCDPVHTRAGSPAIPPPQPLPLYAMECSGNCKPPGQCSPFGKQAVQNGQPPLQQPTTAVQSSKPSKALHGLHDTGLMDVKVKQLLEDAEARAQKESAKHLSYPTCVRTMSMMDLCDGGSLQVCVCVCVCTCECQCFVSMVFVS